MIHLPLLVCAFPSRLMFFISKAIPIVKFDPMGGVIEAIKLSYLRKGVDISTQIKLKLNWYNTDLAAQAEFANDFSP